MATKNAYSKCKSAVVLLFILLLPIFAYATLVDQSDSTILDNSTQLLWSKGIFGSANWADATSAASDSTHAGYTDWRLPTLAELNSLVDSDYWPQIDPVFNMGYGIGDWMHWTSSTIDDDDYVLSDRAYTVFFDNGEDQSVPKGNYFHYRLVRTYEALEPMLWDSSLDSVAWTAGGDLIKWD